MGTTSALNFRCYPFGHIPSPQRPGERREILLDGLPQCKLPQPARDKYSGHILPLFSLFHQYFKKTSQE
jgi:hypothetical protein